MRRLGGWLGEHAGTPPTWGVKPIELAAVLPTCGSLHAASPCAGAAQDILRSAIQFVTGRDLLSDKLSRGQDLGPRNELYGWARMPSTKAVAVAFWYAGAPSDVDRLPSYTAATLYSTKIC